MTTYCTWGRRSQQRGEGWKGPQEAAFSLGRWCMPPTSAAYYLPVSPQRLPAHCATATEVPSHTGTSTGEKAEGSGPNTKKLLFAHACMIHLSRDNTVVKDLKSEPALVSKHSFRKCHLNSPQKFTLFVQTFWWEWQLFSLSGKAWISHL